VGRLIVPRRSPGRGGPFTRWRWTRTAASARGPDEESTAAGIYGIIVSAAVMAATHAQRAVTVVAAALVTLVTYWAAERYARLVAERIHAGQRPAWHQVRRQLTRGWEMVSASLLPLVVLVLAAGLGAGTSRAVTAALVASTVLLCGAGWEIGRNGRLKSAERVVSAAVAGRFGVAMIVAKGLLH
jgi:positive regulator of sigma E activity